jgi:hypothetical protein
MKSRSIVSHVACRQTFCYIFRFLLTRRAAAIRAKYPSRLKQLEVRTDAMQFYDDGVQRRAPAITHFSSTFLVYAANKFNYPQYSILEGLARTDRLSQCIDGVEWGDISCENRIADVGLLHIHPAMWCETSRTVTLCAAFSNVSTRWHCGVSCRLLTLVACQSLLGRRPRHIGSGRAGPREVKYRLPTLLYPCGVAHSNRHDG